MSGQGQRVAVLGAGKMGETLMAGMLRAGRAPDEVVFTERYDTRRADLEARHGTRGVTTAEAAEVADTLLLAVKPQEMGALLAELSPVLRPGSLVVSIAAGATCAFLEAGLPAGTPVVRVMSNTPALVDEAMSALSAGSCATEEHLARATELLRSVGQVITVPEDQLDAVTALSGSGPAYFFFLVEAMIDAGILLGLPRAVAHQLIVQTAVGSAVMLRDSGEHPVALREAVTSPAGTTISAIRELENHGVRAAILSALEAARDRGRELAGG